MRQDIGVGLVEVSGLDPMRCADRVEGHGDLVEQVGVVQVATKAVIQNIHIFWQQFCSFFAPDPCQFPVFEGDRLDLLPLSLILHPSEDDSVACGFALQSQGIQIDFPEAPGVRPKHAVNCRLQLRESAVPIGFFDFSDHQEVRAGVNRVGQLCNIILGNINRFSGSGRTLKNAVSSPPFIHLAEDRVEPGRSPKLHRFRHSHS